MADSTSIRLSPKASPEKALSTTRSVLEDRGYLWEPTSQAAAQAHQGGKPMRNRRTARRLSLDVSAQDRQLKLDRRVSGGVGFALNLGPLIAMRVRREFRRVHHAIEQALRSNGLAE